MSVFDLRQWLADAERAGELQHILGAGAVLDIGAASQLSYRRKHPRAAARSSATFRPAEGP